MSIVTRVISFCFLALFCWQLAVLFVAPFVSDGSAYNHIYGDQFEQCSDGFDLINSPEEAPESNWTSTFFEEVMEEEIEMTGNVHVCLLLSEFNDFANQVVLRCKDFSSAHPDPPEHTV